MSLLLNNIMFITLAFLLMLMLQLEFQHHPVYFPR